MCVRLDRLSYSRTVLQECAESEDMRTALRLGDAQRIKMWIVTEDSDF